MQIDKQGPYIMIKAYVPFIPPPDHAWTTHFHVQAVDSYGPRQDKGDKCDLRIEFFEVVRPFRNVHSMDIILNPNESFYWGGAFGRLGIVPTYAVITASSGRFIGDWWLTWEDAEGGPATWYFPLPGDDDIKTGFFQGRYESGSNITQASFLLTFWPDENGLGVFRPIQAWNREGKRAKMHGPEANFGPGQSLQIGNRMHFYDVKKDLDPAARSGKMQIAAEGSKFIGYSLFVGEGDNRVAASTWMKVFDFPTIWVG